MATKSLLDKEPVDIIIPTLNNFAQLRQCVESISATRFQYPMRFIIVNNGTLPLEKFLHPPDNDFVYVNTKENLGWTGGIAEGLKHSTSKYVMFANDDIFVPRGSWRWLSTMIRHLALRPEIGSVGPVSNCVMGSQQIFRTDIPMMCFCSNFLIGFCVLHRRSTLDEIGGVDPEFKNGDDLDISIRMMKAGYYQMVDSSCFVYHHGFQTGEKVHGGPAVVGGWNSSKMNEETNMALIRKHGFLSWWYMLTGWPADWPMKSFGDKRQETEVVRAYVNGCDPSQVVDLGCGGSKVVPGSIGVDILPRGEKVPNTAYASDCDIVADVQKPMPFDYGRFKFVIGRHILEHCIDQVGALWEWKRILADDGRMILCLPDERLADTIILNPEHVHAYTPETLGRLVAAVGLQVEKVEDFYGNDSFTMVLKKGNFE